MGESFPSTDHREDPDIIIATLGAERYGVFSRVDAIARGVTRNELEHRLRTGRLSSLHRGVYRITGSRDSWHQRLMAETLAQPRGVVSHRSAARLERLSVVEEGVLEFTVPSWANRKRSGVILHMGDLLQNDMVTMGPFTVTHPARTLFDLASVCEIDVVEEALDDAIARRIVTPARLRWELEQIGKRGRTGVGTMRTLLGARDSYGSESRLETRLLRLIRRARLPQPTQQHRIWSDGRIVARADLAYPQERIAIEADGRGVHARPRTWQRDIEKMNALARLGWRFLRFTWADVHDRPGEVVDAIRDLLRA